LFIRPIVQADEFPYQSRLTVITRPKCTRVSSDYLRHPTSLVHRIFAAIINCKSFERDSGMIFADNRSDG
jgi:hypothetical protein